jgi:DNA-binding CsgD family transcriptional regulator
VAGSVFVGRQGERERLASVLRGDSGSAGAALVTGDAGIGKSRLLAEVARSVPDVAVLVGSCLPMSESLPYGAITDAFDQLTGPAGRPVLDKALSRCAAFVRPQVVALIPAMSDPAHLPPNATVDRTRLFAAVRDLLAALGAARRTALVVEDLHWADPGTLDLLTFLVRNLPAGTALVATSRRDELSTESPVLDWLDTTSRLPSVEQVTLVPLPADDVASLVASLVGGDAADAFVADVERRGQGNPFFTEQLVAAARDVAPPLEVPPGVPAGVAQMLLARVRSVGAAASDVAAVLAVAARPLGERELTACVGTGGDVATGLRDLLDSHLAESAEQDRYRLRHALLEDAVRATLLASQRATLHAGVAAVLAARGGENPGEVAAHWSQAGNKVEEAHWSVRAARQAEGVFAWREATGWWHRVWEVWDALPPDGRPPIELAEATVAAVVDAERADDDPTFVRLAEEALADHRINGDDQAIGHVLRLKGDRLLRTDPRAGLAVLEMAVARFDRSGKPSAEQALALAILAQSKITLGIRTGTEDEELARSAIIAEQVGAFDVLIEMAADRSVAQIRAGDVEEGLAGLSEVWERAQQLGGGAVLNGAAVNLTDAYLWLLRLGDGIRTGRRGMEQLLGHGYRYSMEFSLALSNTVDCLRLSGDRDAAEELVARYLRPEATRNGWPLNMSRAELDLLDDNPTAALTQVQQVTDLSHDSSELQMWLAEVGAEAELGLGRPHAAWQRIASTWAAILGSPSEVRTSRLLALAARAGADLAETEPDTDREALSIQLRQRADATACFAEHAALVLGAAYGATFDAELARLERSPEEPAWQAAKDTWASHGVPHHAAYAGWRLAVCLLDRGRRNDGQSELVAAYAAAQHNEPLRREIEALARRARLPLEAAAQMPEPSDAAATTAAAASGLTPRELDVLRLLGTGASNDEIGHRLYISPKTASVHVTHIFRKLGVTGRVQAAMVAERMGLLTRGSGND